MSLFNFFSSVSADPGDSDAGETVPAKMDLEERMAYRRDLLYETIAVTMEFKGFSADAYCLRVSRTDKRGHSFAVMIELNCDFLGSAYGSQAVLGEIGRVIAVNAKASGFLEVVGVFWRIGNRPEVIDSGFSDTAMGEPGRIARSLRKGGNLDIDPSTYASDIAPLAMADGKFAMA